jgi:hypothetical protein
MEDRGMMVWFFIMNSLAVITVPMPCVITVPQLR